MFSAWLMGVKTCEQPQFFHSRLGSCKHGWGDQGNLREDITNHEYIDIEMTNLGQTCSQMAKSCRCLQQQKFYSTAFTEYGARLVHQATGAPSC